MMHQRPSLVFFVVLSYDEIPSIHTYRRPSLCELVSESMNRGGKNEFW